MVYNPKLTICSLDELNITGHLFELWIPLIDSMRFDFEYRRTAMAFFSLLLIDSHLLCDVLKSNLIFIISKGIEVCSKLTDIKEKKIEQEEAEVSGEDSSEYDDNDYDSIVKSARTKLKDFIENDDDCYDEEGDEDYDEINDMEELGESNNRNIFKTNLDEQDEFIYIRNVLDHLSLNSYEFYNYIMNNLPLDKREVLLSCIQKAESRMSVKIK